MKPNMFLDMERKEFQSVYSNSSKPHYQSNNSSYQYGRNKNANTAGYNLTRINKTKNF